MKKNISDLENELGELGHYNKDKDELRKYETDFQDSWNTMKRPN